ncbi:Peroxiredoxin [Chitinophaga sp. YR627]|jgi:peroxiredoxin|uniref:Alkyl hydroperoxide reductase/ Thiol specific antioxidant/ Mal allergen n=1 Tax=Chitinophaga pinensis (strain ATCC 43595 / DSM 2588 / LMG 13176 / NBRC 15968 / NCIMB 11800 / UQM 2034) TaxID=485918 RepID=A0A979GBM1_CHIPD|nr:MULTISPECIES: redoxin domain-containing protein [Chitinophaga]ACU64302.1 alkyl hydroperoxide reductase/ Thiol specific antioxidant/ Mal allergen [Chitinophaga pinensis DSM 2588]SFO15210.1 Peroxiredoxin [Chitinophaga sp. YR627]
MNVTVGAKAPSFSLLNTEKQKVSLEDFKGQNLVILFFPLAFTSVCTAELCSIRDNIGTYNDLNTAVVGISVDSPFTLGKFKAEQNLNFPLLSDFNKDISQAYGAFYENFVLDLKGVSKRSAFVVDKEGVVRYAQVLESAGDLPDFEAVKNTLNGLQ